MRKIHRLCGKSLPDGLMIHVAVLLKPYVDLVLAGTKRVECRLTQNPLAPFESIEPGERIYLKQSGGPYRATAVAGEVMFEANLTPTRVRQLYKHYNHLICGELEFWTRKKFSRFAALVWLEQVEAAAIGPALPPSRGLAWRVIEAPESAAPPRRRTAGSPALSFGVELTPGNLRNNSLYVTGIRSHFPRASFGGRNRKDAGRPFTLMLDGGTVVETDIVADRNLFRTRAWGKWFEAMGAKAGDRVVFTPLNGAAYFVGLARSRKPVEMEYDDVHSR
jgi:ASC-1-like (ASCH) protein